MEDAAGGRAVVLVDGEHYPAVVRASLGELAGQGLQPVAAFVLGGTEKVARHGADLDLGLPVAWATQGAELATVAGEAVALCGRERADLVYDLSDEPVLDARRRMQLAAHVLAAGLVYLGADFRFDPPPRPVLLERPSIAVIGTGKRTGKTAVSGEITRQLQALGRTPVVVAMGRGGPPDPLVVPAGTELGPDELLAVADAGGHAASDFYEDALTTGAATVGARRCGGGLAGAVAHSNVARAVAVAGDLGGDIVVLEGSGSAVPPVHADATVLVVPADADPELVAGYLGGYRVLLADLILVTMCESPRATPTQVDRLLETLRSISRAMPSLRTVLRPVPLGPVSGARVFFATTAPAAIGAPLAESLEELYGCEVVGMSSHLANRPALQADLDQAPAYEVLLVECKAAAVDVAARNAARAGARVVFCDNRPVLVSDGEARDQATAAGTTIAAAVSDLAALAEHRFSTAERRGA